MLQNLLSSGFVSYQLFFWALAIVLAMIVIAKILSAPIHLAFKILLHALAGLVMLFVVNFVGSIINFNIPITWLTCIIAGVLGAPGVVLLFIFQWAGIV